MSSLLPRWVLHSFLGCFLPLLWSCVVPVGAQTSSVLYSQTCTVSCGITPFQQLKVFTSLLILWKKTCHCLCCIYVGSFRFFRAKWSFLSSSFESYILSLIHTLTSDILHKHLLVCFRWNGSFMSGERSAWPKLSSYILLFMRSGNLNLFCTLKGGWAALLLCVHLVSSKMQVHSSDTTASLQERLLSCSLSRVAYWGLPGLGTISLTSFLIEKELRKCLAYVQ